MSKLIEKQLTTIYVPENEDGTYTLDKKQKKLIDGLKLGLTTEECPACDGDGILDCEYCSVCRGKGTFTYTKQLDIRPLKKKEWHRYQLLNLRGAALAKYIRDNPEQQQLLFTDKPADWRKIPAAVQAISVCSRGEVRLYSSPSGIYTRYDDEHSTCKQHKGDQHWYFGTSLPGLDITAEHEHLNIVVAGKSQALSQALFIRPGAKKAVLDFDKPFDWRYFPPAVTKLLVTFGDMNVQNQTIRIAAGSKEIYLREDNVISGLRGRTNWDKSFNIYLVNFWVDDGTDAYPRPVDTSGVSTNEMNFEFRNIPYKTVVYELPANRRKKVAPNQLRQLNVEDCADINRHTRPISDSYTVAQYPFKYSDKRRAAEEWLLRHCGSFSEEGYAYTINGKNEISIDGSIRYNGGSAKKPYRFINVTGTFAVFGQTHHRGVTAVPDLAAVLPKKCGELVISHFGKDLTDITVGDTEVTSGVLRLQFIDGLKTFGKAHKSINTMHYLYVDNLEDVEFHPDSVRLVMEERDSSDTLL